MGSCNAIKLFNKKNERGEEKVGLEKTRKGRGMGKGYMGLMFEKSEKLRKLRMIPNTATFFSLPLST